MTVSIRISQENFEDCDVQLKTCFCSKRAYVCTDMYVYIDVWKDMYIA